MGRERTNIIPAPDRVLIKITKQQIENLTSKEIIRDDGTKARLFLEPDYEKGYERRFQQNVSAGTIVAVGDNVKGIYTSDVAILDYLSTNDDDILIGWVGGDQLISFIPKTTYHEKSAPPLQDGRRAWVKGDFDHISQLLGIIRNDKIIAFHPYVFLVAKSNLILTVTSSGIMAETKESISEREILSAPKGSPYKDGDKILIKETDMFSRHIRGKEISVVFMQDILCKK